MNVKTYNFNIEGFDPEKNNVLITLFVYGD